MMIDTEWSAREQRKLTRRLRVAKLRYPASVEDIDFTTPRGSGSSGRALAGELCMDRGEAESA